VTWQTGGWEGRLKLRIAISTPAYPLPGDPTRGRYIYEIARCLGRLATVEVFFHTGRYPRHRWLQPQTYIPTPVTTNLSTADVKVSAFDYPSFPVVSRVANGHLSGRALLQRLKPFRPDVVLAYWIFPEGYGAWRCARQLGIRCVLGGLGTDIRARDGLTRWFTGRALRGADESIMVSEEMRTLALARYKIDPARTHTITNGVNTSIFYPKDQALMRRQLGLPAAARVILYVGRFVATKGLRELIDAYALLEGRIADLHLVLVGNGVMQDELQKRIATSTWGPKVHLPGAMQPEAVSEWINAADTLCLPSYSEGYPNVVVEALACGRPVVATQVGGTPELVNETNGLLVAPRDHAALQQALAAALQRQWNHEAIAASWSRSWNDVALATFAVCQKAGTHARSAAAHARGVYDRSTE
jgi:teichuronic acid biosynthesis glycosyltransferase TuaC